MKRFALVVLFAMCVSVLGSHTSPVKAEDLKRWKVVDSAGNILAGIVVEGLPSIYSTRVINYDPGGVSPNRCANGCTYILDSYQNVEGTTSTSSIPSNIGSGSPAATTTTVPFGSAILTGWTLRIAQLSQNQMQINGCIDYSGSSSVKVFHIVASWTISSNGSIISTGKGESLGLNLQARGTTCPTQFLANVSGLTASTEYLVTYTGGAPGNMVTGARTIVTSNAPSTTTTVSPGVTVPKVGVGTTVPSSRPQAPSNPQVALLASSSVRVSWGDSSTNESGFIIQRSDSPVGAGVSTAMWPYKTAANVTSYDFSGLAAGSQVCFAVASFNNTGASKFSEWGCLNLANPGGAVAPPPDATLSCDGVVVRNLSTGASFRVSVGASNAGRLLGFEYYEKGRWIVLGQARVDASGAATLSLKSVPISKVGSYPIRATQGSRFICEGDLTISQKLKAYRKK